MTIFISSVKRIFLAVSTVIIIAFSFLYLKQSYESWMKGKDEAIKSYIAAYSEHPRRKEFFTGTEEEIIKKILLLSQEDRNLLHDQGLCFVNIALERNLFHVAEKLIENRFQQTPCRLRGGDLPTTAISKKAPIKILSQLDDLLKMPENRLEYAINTKNIEAFQYIFDALTNESKNEMIHWRNKRGQGLIELANNELPLNILGPVKARLDPLGDYEILSHQFFNRPKAIIPIRERTFLIVGNLMYFQPIVYTKDKALKLHRNGGVTVEPRPSEAEFESKKSEIYSYNYLQNAASGNVQLLKYAHCDRCERSLIRKTNKSIIVILYNNREILEYPDFDIKRVRRYPLPSLGDFSVDEQAEYGITRKGQIYILSPSIVYGKKVAGLVALTMTNSHQTILEGSSLLDLPKELSSPNMQPNSILSFEKYNESSFALNVEYLNPRQMAKVSCQQGKCVAMLTSLNGKN